MPAAPGNWAMFAESLPKKDSVLAEKHRSLDDVLRTLSAEQLRFVSVRMFCGSDADAAREIGMRPSRCYGWDNKQDVNEAVKLAQLDGTHVAVERLKRMLNKGIDALEAEIDGKRNRLDAVKELFDRVWGKAVQRNENDQSGDVVIRVVYDRNVPDTSA